MRARRLFSAFVLVSMGTAGCSSRSTDGDLPRSRPYDDDGTDVRDSGIDEHDAGGPSPSSAAPSTDQGSSGTGKGDTSERTQESGDTADSTSDATGVSTEPPTTFNGGLCRSSGWCWVNPPVFGERVTAFNGDAAAGELFAVTDEGLVLQWQDERWRYHLEFTDLPLTQVAVVDEVDVWVGGYGGVWHYDGQSWTLTTEQPCMALDVAGDGTVFASLDGQLVRFDGESWHDEGLNAERRVVDLLADEATSEVWAVEIDLGDGPHSPTVQHYHDGSWARLTGAGPDVYFWPKLTKIDGDLYVYSTDLWNVSRDWAMLDLAVGSVDAGEFVRDVLVRDGDVYIARSSGIFRLENSVEVPFLEGTYEALADAGKGETWIAEWSGGVAKVRSEHQSGSLVEPSNAERFQWGDVPAAVWAGANVAWGASGNDVWAAPRRHFDGEVWTDVAGASEFRSIDGSAADDVWFTDAAGVLSHWDGTSLTQPQSMPEGVPMDRFATVEVMGRDDVWVVAQPSEVMQVLHFDGVQWSHSLTVPYELSRVPLVPYLSAAAGSLWFSTNTELLQFDGSDWNSRVTFDRYQPLPIVADAAEVWVATSSQLFSWDGETLGEHERGPSSIEHLQVLGSSLWAWGYNQVMVKQH